MFYFHQVLHYMHNYNDNHTNIYHDFCDLESKMEDDCETDVDCQSTVIHSHCNADHVCVCGGGEQVYTHEGRSYCYLKITGEQCVKNKDCLSEYDTVSIISLNSICVIIVYYMYLLNSC